MKYYHVDVFSEKKFSGNGLTVFVDAGDLDKKFMQLLTREMRQFESVFFHKTGPNTFRAFIFTMEEELDFAGHPIIGAAALLHDLYSKEKEQDNWTIHLNAKSVAVQTRRNENYYSARMNQGKAEFRNVLSKSQEKEFLAYFKLTENERSW